MNMTDPRDPVASVRHSGFIAALRKYPARLILALGITGSAFAQTAETTPAPTTTTTTATTTTVSTATAAPADEPVTMGAYQVNGYASSLAASLSAKRSSEDNVEVI